jgi:tRNA A-37 threonylcarbamoyl transferase component Bud32
MQVVIDLGLSQQSTIAEDKAVDLYVLERAFKSAHSADGEGLVRTPWTHVPVKRNCNLHSLVKYLAFAA